MFALSLSSLKIIYMELVWDQGPLWVVHRREPRLGIQNKNNIQLQ